MLKDFLAYFVPMWKEVETSFQNAFGVIDIDLQVLKSSLLVMCDVAMVLIWIGVFLSLIKAVKRPEKSIVYMGLCEFTGTDFGLFNSFVLMAAICAIAYNVGPIEAGLIMVLALYQFHEVGQSVRSVVKKGVK